MAGLSLGIMGGVSSSQGNGFSTPPAATAGAAAFGPGYTASGVPNATTALTPNDPFGVAFWTGILCLGALLLIRHSLPA